MSNLNKDADSKIEEIRKRIGNHKRWIIANRFDADGVKERKEWIDELEEELLNLQNNAD